MLLRTSQLLMRNITSGFKLLNYGYSTEPSLSFVKKIAIQPSLKPWCTSFYLEQYVSGLKSPPSCATSLSSLMDSSRPILDLHLPTTIGVFHLPTGLYIPKVDVPLPHNIIDTPPQDGIVEKRAARLIVIRRRKMKKHQRRKLWKRMRFEWAKIHQRRELHKEKEFQGVLVAQIKEAEAFDAVRYVAEKLHKAHEKPPPKGKSIFQDKALRPKN